MKQTKIIGELNNQLVKMDTLKQSLPKLNLSEIDKKKPKKN